MVKESIFCSKKHEKKEKFRLMQILVIVFLLQCCVVVVSAKPIGYGDYVNGTISTPAAWESYSLSGSAGDPIYCRLKTSWPFSGQILLYAPNGTLIASPQGQSGTELTMVLPVKGTYTLMVGDSGGDNTGTYDLYLQRTKDPASPVLIHYGDYVNGTIPYPALYRTYTFSGTVGDSIYLRLKTSWPFSGQIRLYAPNGTLIASPEGQSGTELTMVLPVTGTYTLLAGDSGGDNTGTYDLYLQRTKDPASPVLIHYGDYVNGTIPYLALYRTYTFSGTVGDPIYLRLKTSWPFSGQIRLYAPNGTLITSPDGQSGTELILILPMTGTYTMLVGDSGGDNTGAYDLYLQRTKDPANPYLIGYGDLVNGVIPHLALYDTYVFNGEPGDTTYLRLKTSWPFSGKIRMYAPNGTLIASPEGQSGTELTMVLPVTGTYTLLVGDSVGDTTGTYNLYLQSLGSRAVTADFSANPTYGTIPLAVQFTDDSSNEPYAWRWDFGNGNTSTLQNPSTTYSTVGHYSVSLMATNMYRSNTTLKPKYITATYAVIPLPGYAQSPTDPDDDFIFEDLNGNGRLDFADVVLYFNQMEWIAAHEPVGAFDLNGNGRIDFADIVKLFGEI